MDDGEVTNDPFAPENVGTVQLIMQMRLYDVMMALLKEANPEAARNLLELHSEGTILGTAPRLNGVFLTDEMNAERE